MLFCFMPYHTYILYSSSLDKYYIGSTENIEHRVEEHNSGKGNYTSRGLPWALVYKEEFATRSEALKREYEIKRKKSRKYIEWLISSAG